MAVALLLAGCATTELHEVDLRAAPPAKGPAALYMMGQPTPAAPVYDIALLQAVGYRSDGGRATFSPSSPSAAAFSDATRSSGVQVDQGYTMVHAYGVCVKYARIARGAGASGLGGPASSAGVKPAAPERRAVSPEPPARSVPPPPAGRPAETTTRTTSGTTA